MADTSKPDAKESNWSGIKRDSGSTPLLRASVFAVAAAALIHGCTPDEGADNAFIEDCQSLANHIQKISPNTRAEFNALSFVDGDGQRFCVVMEEDVYGHTDLPVYNSIEADAPPREMLEMSAEDLKAELSL